MPTSINRFIPLASVLAVALYWSWPALKDALPHTVDAAGKAGSKRPDAQAFSAAVLIPQFLPFPQRNPFLPADYKSKKATLARSGKPGTHGTKWDAAAKTAGAANSSLVLNATCIMGKQRMAIINGRVYKEKEAILQPGDQTPSCIIAAILPHKVLLLSEGKTVQLGYVDGVAKHAAKDKPGTSAR